MWLHGHDVDDLLVEAHPDDPTVGPDVREHPVVPATALAESIADDGERHPRHDHHVEFLGRDRAGGITNRRREDEPTAAAPDLVRHGGHVRFTRDRLEPHHHAGHTESDEALHDRRRSGDGRHVTADPTHPPPELRFGLVRRPHGADSNVDDVSDTPAIDPKQFRTVLGHFPTGVTIVSGMEGEHPIGFTIGSFTSVSLDPPLVGFLPQTNSSTWEAMARSGSFCVNVLSRHQADLCWKFAKSDHATDRFDDVSWHPGPTGSPIIDRAVAWIDCNVEEVYEMGDHYFVLGRVVALEADANQDGEGPFPLLFFKGTLGGFAAEG